MDANDFIPNQWYPIFDSSKLKQRKPVGIMRLGERLVLWRDGNGTAVCMADRCPHRAAQLSLGWVRDDCLVCPFHGLRFDYYGRCVLIPANGEGQPVPRGFDLTLRQVREAHGLIWYWYGESAPAAEIPWFPEAPDPGPRTSFVQRDYPVSYLRVMENLGDMHHVPFVHRATIPGAGTRVEMQEARLDGAVIRMKVSLHHERPGWMRPTYNFTYAIRLPTLATIEVAQGYSLSPARPRSIATIRGCGRDTDRTIFQDGWAAESSRGWLRSSTWSWCSPVRTCGCSQASSAMNPKISRPINCSRRIARLRCISVCANRR